MISGVNDSILETNKMISDVNFINKTVDSLITSENQTTASETKNNNNNSLHEGKDMDETSLLGGVSNFASAVTGSIGTQLSKLEKTDMYNGYVNKDSVITSVLPHQDTTTPLKVLGKTGKVLTIATTGADIANTIAANDGNTNTQKAIKAGIKVAGVVISTEISGIVTAALIPETGPVAIAGGIATDALVGEGVNHVEDYIYKKLNIK